MASWLAAGNPEYTVRECVPLPLGVEVNGGRMWVMIGARSSIPAQGESKFHTLVHNQTSLRFKVFEGPWQMTKRNVLIHEFVVDNIPKAEVGAEPVLVRFTVNEDGILRVTARVVSGGNEISLEVKKKGFLFNGKRVNYSMDDIETERALDARESDEAYRRTEGGDLNTNLRKFFEMESAKNPSFRSEVPVDLRDMLVQRTEPLVSSPPADPPALSEITATKSFIRERLQPYFDRTRNGVIPMWLKA